MRAGSVVVDIAAEQGGNCELTRAGEVVEHQGVKVVGAMNLPAELAYNASEMYARNLFNFLKPALNKGELAGRVLLCLPVHVRDSGARRGNDPRVHSQPRTGGQAAGPTETAVERATFRWLPGRA